MKPVFALVGRPNVGKSTLFNRLTKSRDAIVADYAGLTRDRHYGNSKLDKQDFIVIDTGGFEPDASAGIYREMAKQTRQAVAEADVVLFLVDARDGISGQDHDIANYLRRLGKPCLLVANKSEGLQAGLQVSEFFELGLGAVQAISAAHGQGIRPLIELERLHDCRDILPGGGNSCLIRAAHHFGYDQCCQHAKNNDHDHDFDQGKSRLTCFQSAYLNGING